MPDQDTKQAEYQPTCDKCKRPKADAKYDHGTRKVLCNPCWFSTEPGQF